LYRIISPVPFPGAVFPAVFFFTAAVFFAGAAFFAVDAAARVVFFLVGVTGFFAAAAGFNAGFAGLFFIGTALAMNLHHYGLSPAECGKNRTTGTWRALLHIHYGYVQFTPGTHILSEPPVVSTRSQPGFLSSS
jgi:hypothetical protein